MAEKKEHVETFTASQSTSKTETGDTGKQEAVMQMAAPSESSTLPGSDKERVKMQ